MIVEVVCLPSWELVRESKTWKHVRRCVAARYVKRRAARAGAGLEQGEPPTTKGLLSYSKDLWIFN